MAIPTKRDKCHLSRYTTQAANNATSVTGVSTRDYHQYTDIVSSGDFVTLDKDHNSYDSNPGSLLLVMKQ